MRHIVHAGRASRVEEGFAKTAYITYEITVHSQKRENAAGQGEKPLRQDQLVLCSLVLELCRCDNAGVLCSRTPMRGLKTFF
jgi:hypothetical protein